MSQSETPVGTIVTKSQGWSWFLIIGLLIHIPLFIYPVLRLGGWLDLNAWLISLILLPLATSQVISRLYMRHNKSRWARWYRRGSDFWLGLSPILLLVLLTFEVLVPVFDMNTRIAAGWVVSITLVIGFLGFVNALMPFVKTIKLTSSKIDRPLRFVQITDVHIGSRNSSFLEEIVYKINQLNPDFVCITGDFIDASGVEESQLRSLKSIAGPIYFSIGNHEKYEDLDDIVQRLTNLGVIVLRDEAIQDERGVQVIGIDDMDDALQVKRQLSHIPVSHTDFVLLLYHRPRGLSSAAEAGVDLMLSGHTHNGQIVPFNLVVNQVFDQSVGLHKDGHTHLYVSQGTGTWGPIMRVGTRSEITLFEVSPA